MLYCCVFAEAEVMFVRRIQLNQLDKKIITDSFDSLYAAFVSTSVVEYLAKAAVHHYYSQLSLLVVFGAYPAIIHPTPIILFLCSLIALIIEIKYII